ncbi:NADH:flavin oxidoreductase/NADH oxidase [Phreatobacter aquaticus]|uniref:NADH:flavin oxidoreductase/NADH oxidase n=1 Tax=Phreatobacter aquaticus TaxID=2570229 RepID=A0A4D7QU37_9HYPH|nr:NADH:flavin oxidoreductase/NADH oxidase [Phreatobacter aquaticus]QCK88889.1 NADH:flavin oxidoreductase/NADH oxidase [Phreatobacter aquaticus]
MDIGNVRLRNRIVLSPMAQYSADGGMATDWHFTHFAKFAVGGAGLVFTEAVKVERRGLGTIGDMGLWSDAHIAPLARIAAFVSAQGAKAGIQLNHAGRKAGTFRPWEGFGPLDRTQPLCGQDHWEVIGPSAIPHLEGWPVPRELGTSEIAEVIEAWASAARRALAAGFDVLEIHGAHGYLVHQFLSEAANKRIDRYGGHLANRMRFALEIAEAVRAVWPQDKPLFFRVSAVDSLGWSLEDTVKLARELKGRGVDVVDCSSGGLGTGSPTSSPHGLKLGYQVGYAEAVRREAEIATMAVGLIVSGRQAERILREGSADLVAVGREMLLNPQWPISAALDLMDDAAFDLMPPHYGWWLDKRMKSGLAHSLNGLKDVE